MSLATIVAIILSVSFRIIDACKSRTEAKEENSAA